MTYREPDPDRQAEADEQIAAEERIEQAAARGRDARSHNKAGVEKRLLDKPGRRGRGGAAIVWGTSFAAYMTAIVAGVTVPIGLGIGAAGLVVGAAGVTAVDRL